MRGKESAMEGFQAILRMFEGVSSSAPEDFQTAPIVIYAVFHRVEWVVKEQGMRGEGDTGLTVWWWIGWIGAEGGERRARIRKDMVPE